MQQALCIGRLYWPPVSAACIGRLCLLLAFRSQRLGPIGLQQLRCHFCLNFLNGFAAVATIRRALCIDLSLSLLEACLGRLKGRLARLTRAILAGMFNSVSMRSASSLLTAFFSKSVIYALSSASVVCMRP